MTDFFGWSQVGKLYGLQGGLLAFNYLYY
jgi:hypothetical protein